MWYMVYYETETNQRNNNQMGDSLSLLQIKNKGIHRRAGQSKLRTTHSI